MTTRRSVFVFVAMVALLVVAFALREGVPSPVFAQDPA
jgi:hypothetical protein